MFVIKFVVRFFFMFPYLNRPSKILPAPQNKTLSYLLSKFFPKFCNFFLFLIKFFLYPNKAFFLSKKPIFLLKIFYYFLKSF